MPKKDRKTRDAVRSVLERFTGAGAKPAAPDAAETPANAPAAAEAAKPN
jgi:AsmA protein